MILKKNIFSKNVWSIGIGAIFVWLGFAGLGCVMVDKCDKVFHHFFWITVFSFLLAGLITKVTHWILTTKFSIVSVFFDFSWIFILALGSLLFTCFLQISSKTYSEYFGIIFGVFTLCFIPAGLFRLLVNFTKSLFLNPKNSQISIVA